MKRHIIIYLIITVLIITTDGCRCSGGEGDVAPTIPTPIVEIRTGDSEWPTHPSDFSLRIDVSNAVNVAGIYFRLNFDSKIIQLKDKSNPVNSVTEGTFFNKDSVTTNLMVNFLDQNPDSGCLLVGLSRVGGKSGISGTGGILTFTFTTVTKGTTSVYFSKTPEENSLFTPELENIPAVSWVGRDITVK